MRLGPRPLARLQPQNSIAQVRRPLEFQVLSGGQHLRFQFLQVLLRHVLLLVADARRLTFDAAGNLYVTEIAGKRVQRYVRK